MADSDKLRMRRYRLHSRGDHSICRVGRCPEAGTVATADVRELAAAVEREFVGDAVRLAASRRLVALASGSGQTAVSAIKSLIDLVEVKRGRAFQPIDLLDDDVVAVAAEVAQLAEEKAFERFVREAEDRVG